MRMPNVPIFLRASVSLCSKPLRNYFTPSKPEVDGPACPSLSAVLAGSRLVAKFCRFLFDSTLIELGFQLARHGACIAYEVVS